MKRDFQANENIDVFARELLKVTALRHDEIETIAEDPRLFSSVRARIISDGVARNETVNGGRSTRRVLALSMAAMLIVAGVIVAAFLTVRKVERPIVVQQPHSKQNNLSTTGTNDERDAYQLPQAIKQGDDTVQPKYERAIYRPAPERRASQRTETPKETPMEFYALADLRASEEGIANGRVVRVELPKASLVALGVNIPLDSDKQLIKTDLLLGSDGVPRAIRLVE